MVFVRFPAGLFPWSSHEKKFSFDIPNDTWKDMGEERRGALKDSDVDFSSSGGYFFSVATYSSRVDAVLPWESARKTLETSLSMLRASTMQVWLTRGTPDCFVNGVPGYKMELCYFYGGRLYAGAIIVLVKNNIHYRLLYVALDDVYEASLPDYQKILTSFKISD
ncbi:MAG: hypothetical protein LBC99_07195 [Spirochaetota bacterium]|jgi:hypothetical protein|nr:hypothetical protein [Spirochaetota bacterium]